MGQSAVKAMAKAKTEAVWPEGTIPGSASKLGALWGTPPGQAGFEETGSSRPGWLRWKK